MRMIDKDALLSDIERTIVESGCVNHEGEIMDCVRYAPEVDDAPVVRGEWVYHCDDLFPMESTQECSVCHEEEYITLRNDNYCPSCGAKMESEGGT